MFSQGSFEFSQRRAGTHRDHQFAGFIAHDTAQGPGVEHFALERLAVKILAATPADAQGGAIGGGGANARGNLLQG
jgi:hypothetical protein